MRASVTRSQRLSASKRSARVRFRRLKRHQPSRGSSRSRLSQWRSGRERVDSPMSRGAPRAESIFPPPPLSSSRPPSRALSARRAREAE